jgi:MscS family membrane protein
MMRYSPAFARACAQVAAGLLLLAFVPALSSAQNAFELSSPHHTLSVHLQSLEGSDFRVDRAAKVFNPARHSAEEAADLALKLLQIYKAGGLMIDLDQVPVQPDYTDSLTRSHRYLVSHHYPDIYLERTGGKWYYSEHTAASIPELHSRAFPLGAEMLLDALPQLGTREVLGLQLWQHIGLLALILLCVVIHKIFSTIIGEIILKMLIRRGHKQIAKKYVGPVARPISILVLFPILLLLVPVLQLPIRINNYAILALRALWPVFATIVFYKLVDLLGHYLESLAARTESKLDDHLVPLVRKALKVFVVIVGGLAILANLDIDIIPLLTGLSIGGLAFALAAQDTLKNFFGSVMIFVDRPFQIGDWITSGTIDGTVEEVGFRATRVRTFRNSVTYVPNGFISSTTIDNHGLRQYRRFYTHIALTYGTPAELINIFVEGLREIVERHPHTRKDYYNIYLNEMGSHSLDIMFYIFFEVPTWPEELRCRHEVLIEIIRLAEKLKVSFAFPTQTLHVESLPDKAPDRPAYLRSTPELKKKLGQYLAEQKEWQTAPKPTATQ